MTGFGLSLGVLGALAGEFSECEFSVSEKFARAARILNSQE
jgi:hypothetical protein